MIDKPRSIAAEQVWDLEHTGIGLDDSCCGRTPADRQLIEAFLCGPSAVGVITREELLFAARDLWSTGRACPFFDDGLDRAATAILGTPCASYEWETAVAIIGLFSRTWAGCPETALDSSRPC